ncbi:MAG: hypothetical protein V2J24_02435 [Pseudomonadales bacterium]|jgi:hypothetical protein|nr:hypothetical protein [Pseudomonadales bacterium]
MPPKEPSSTDDPDASKAASSHWSGPFGLPPFSELIPLGYLYLLLLGLSSESIHYGMLGVNVLDYSDALDVLLSPIALMTDSLAVLAVVVGVPIFFVPYMQFARWLAHRRPTEKNRRFRERPLGELWLSACIAALFFAFLGLGLGQGIKQREALLAGETTPDSRLTFTDGTVIDADVVGINSGYVFYVLGGDTEVTISPIADNLRSLRALSKDG